MQIYAMTFELGILGWNLRTYHWC